MKTVQSIRVLMAALFVGIFLLLPSTRNIASAQGSMGFRMVWDDFRAGFTVNTPGAKWIYFSDPANGGQFIANDGIARTDSHGLHVVAAGTNPTTLQPAFTLTMAQEDDNAFGMSGQLDHYKWVAFMNHTASSGVPGFDALPSQELSCETWLSGRTYGTDRHPFGMTVANANDDLRLAAVAMNVFDFETRLAFDFWLTNERVFVVYSRLPDARTSTNSYAAFTHVIAVAPRDARHDEHLEIAYDKSAGVVRWILDNREVFRVNQIGLRLARANMTLDHGGIEAVVSPNQLNCGMGMFTLLDGYRPSNLGLVRLSNLPYFYFDPDAGEPAQQLFLDNASTDPSRLFGQGAELHMERYVVSSRAVH